MLKASDIQLVCRSWEKLSPNIPEGIILGQKFYKNLFTLDPSLKTLFKGDLTEQSIHFMHIMDTIVNAIDKVDDLSDVVARLGVRHVGYGVQEADYAVFGKALLMTIEQTLADAFTPELKQAWENTYNTLAELMKKGAEAASSVA
ncbi:hemoglobin-like flavoprotein [Beggiatoa alba B18LD]|uniref:Hemoglobin-like flavoprotein n=1 Tax=Beggiatoa alba B18LD TaxID=395493 RepID=I3CJ89_9GAMM|nr:globin domain-containing protein [Beggiatoa alba]EIJ43682.1 hemoglobin-like flavoprotein [Beggiatoa alba B18LD]